MNTTLFVCAIVITVAFVLFVIEAIRTFIQIRHSAKAMETLSINANDRINSIDTALEAAKVISSGISSGWVKMITGVVGLFAAKKAAEKHSKEQNESESDEQD